MEVIYKEVGSIKEFIDAIRIRVDVFIIEQKCQPGWEPDEEDRSARHFIAVADSKVVSTLRIREVENGIKKLKPKKIWMEAQIQAKEFYEKCSFKAVSEPYDLYGIPHLKMEYSNN